MMNKKTLIAISAITSSLLLSACGSSSSNTTASIDENSTPVSIDEKGVQEINSLITVIDQVQTAITTLQTEPNKVPLLSRLNIGEESILATQGVLSVKASCEQSVLSDGPRRPIDEPLMPAMVSEPSEGDTTLTIRYISSITGSLTEERQEDALEGEVFRITSHSGGYAELDIDESSILATTGDYISINGETMLLSTNSQGTDCLVAGMAITMKGSPAPASLEAI